MPEIDLLDLPERLPPDAPAMGLDVGAKTVGLAISDRTRTIASPLVTVHRRKFTADAAAIAAQIAGRGAAALVYGLPVNMDGAEGRRCQSVRQFARNLDGRIALPYAFWDERLSTAAVERLLIGEADMTRKRRAEVVDKAAAAWILQGALDALRDVPRDSPRDAGGAMPPAGRAPDRPA
ncbi:MAG: Holliday junction resolvase RuvX [Rhodospirillaceae bacterium]|nr:Holliday junction resolvase RuvX [Rhodospirillaceae bacterium]MCY4066863.1 Holliday junction resolvase RuvX [Rhodospirillaceae bacterium]